MLTEQQRRRTREGKVEQEVTSSEGRRRWRPVSPEEAGEALDHVTSSPDPGSAGLEIPERLRQECRLRQHESIKQPLGNFSAELASTQREEAFA